MNNSNGLFETIEGAIEYAKTGEITEKEQELFEERYGDVEIGDERSDFEREVKSAKKEYYDTIEGESTTERRKTRIERTDEEKEEQQVTLNGDKIGTVCHISMTSRLPEWAKKDYKLDPDEKEDKIPICFITKDDIRKFGLMVLGNDGTEGLNEKQYNRVRKGIDLYMEGAVKRVGKNEWVIFSNKTYVIGWRNGEYVHLDNHGGDWWYNQPKEAVDRRERLWCKHIIAVHIARKLDCDIDLQEEWGSFKELQNKGV